MADTGTPKEFLEEALQAVNTLSSQKEELSLQKDRKDTAEKLLASLKNSMVHEKDATIMQRRKDIADGFDLQIKKIESEIKSVNSKRESAKQAEMKTRISGLRKPVNEEIKALKSELSDIVKSENLPGICKTRLYHRLFVPSFFSDWALLVLIVAIILVLPYFAAEFFIKNEILQYAAIVIFFLLFAIIYMAIRGATITKNPDGVKKTAEVMKNIRNAKKRLYVISKEVMADQDETKYDLGAFDDELSKLSQNKEIVTKNKDEALLQFDTVTRDVIFREIEDRYSKDIQEAEKNYQELSAKYEECLKNERETETVINGKYLQYIGKENLTSEKISQMVDMISKGEAVSITDAVQKLKR